MKGKTNAISYVDNQSSSLSAEARRIVLDPKATEARKIADQLVMEKLSGHERTKKLLMATLQKESDTIAFGVGENRISAEKNQSDILETLAQLCKEKGVDLQEGKEALLATLVIDELQQQIHEKAYQAIVPYEFSQVMQTKDANKIVKELKKNPERAQEVFEILNEVKEMGTGIKGIQRMKKSTEARKFALKIYQVGLTEQFLQAY